jgi:hypothetical protein
MLCYSLPTGFDGGRVRVGVLIGVNGSRFYVFANHGPPEGQ